MTDCPVVDPKLTFLASLLFITSFGCSGCNSKPAGPDGGTLAISPTSTQATAGGTGMIRFDAVVHGATGTVNWSLSPNTGTLSATTGNEVDYLPPTIASAATPVTLTAKLGSLSASSTITVNPSPGYLSVSVQGLPSNADPAITLTGPNSYSFVLHGSGEVAVPPGAYTVSASADVVGSELGIVSGLYQPSPASSPATVVASQTVDVTITYQPRAGSGYLWLANSSGTLGGFPEAYLGNNGGTLSSITVAGAGNFEAVAVDSSGNVWTTDFAGPIREFTPSMLGDGGAQTPLLTLDGGVLVNTCGIAFDPQGNLWAATFSPARVVKFSGLAGQSGVIPASPAVVISGPQMNSTCAIAFDPAGSLWVADQPSNALLEFASPTSLTGYVTPSPAIVLTNDAGPAAFTNPFGLAFDATGNLWVANLSASVTRVPAASLQHSAGVSPDLTLNNLSAPASVAFDNGGALWILDTGAAALYQLPEAASLSGTVAYDGGWNSFNAGSTDVGGFAFDLTPAGLPIRN